jgi:hypothetical protein
MCRSEGAFTLELPAAKTSSVAAHETQETNGIFLFVAAEAMEYGKAQPLSLSLGFSLRHFASVTGL